MRREDSKWWRDGYTRDWWRELPRTERLMFLEKLTPREREEYFHDWRVWARDEQLAPESDWDTWVMKAGRGWGKTRTAVETVQDWVNEGWARRVAIVGQGEDDVRTVMVNGDSGFIECAPSWNRPSFRPSVGGGILIWPNGCQAFIYSIADTEALRGPQFHAGWCDEPMAAPRAQRERALDNLEFCLRLGQHPRLILSMTPKPDPWLRALEKQARDPENKLVVTGGNTHDNADNLAKNFLRKIDRMYGGTKKGKQEIEGKTLGEEEGALWTEEVLDLHRLEKADPHEIGDSCNKVIVSVDPNTKGSGTPASKAKKLAHAAGIIVTGARGKDRFVLADRSTAGGPAKWVKAAVAAAEEFDADEIIAESNQGGEMIKIVLQQEMADRDYTVPVHLAWSKRSKEGRAEPVSTAYERGDVHHVGPKAALEDLEMQMMYLHEGEDPTGEDFDRCDALVWGLTRHGLKKRASSARGGTGAGITTMGDFGRAKTYQGSSGGHPAEGGDAEL